MTQKQTVKTSTTQRLSVAVIGMFITIGLAIAVVIIGKDNEIGTVAMLLASVFVLIVGTLLTALAATVTRAKQPVEPKLPKVRKIAGGGLSHFDDEILRSMKR